jgi:hypothetical protein
MCNLNLPPDRGAVPLQAVVQDRFLVGGTDVHVSHSPTVAAATDKSSPLACVVGRRAR